MSKTLNYISGCQNLNMAPLSTGSVAIDSLPEVIQYNQ